MLVACHGGSAQPVPGGLDVAIAEPSVPAQRRPLAAGRSGVLTLEQRSRTKTAIARTDGRPILCPLPSTAELGFGAV
jgi:hypothetical protein